MLEGIAYILSDVEWLLKLFVRTLIGINIVLILYLICRRIAKKPKV